MNIPRPEHPDPQRRRAGWKNLNGEWSFAIDLSSSGRARGLTEGGAGFDSRITVPFCPESKLSGVGFTDFMPAVWYSKKIEVTEAELSGRVLLHIGACDWLCQVWVNNSAAGTHRGGYSSFTLDLTSLLTVGENTLVILAEDNTKSTLQPSGKQTMWYASHGCFYTRTTGIWQTVWLEYVPKSYITNFRIDCDVANSAAIIQGVTCGSGTVRAEAFYGGRSCGTAECAGNGTFILTLPLSELHLWEIGAGRLYDLTLTFGEDTVQSYFGMRSIGFDGMRFILNGKPVFQRLVLDQGFYPDGIYTAPDEESLVRDIEISIAAGFNGARLHEKAFEPLFLYHADRLGYLVWGEYPNWGLDYANPEVTDTVLPEWLSLVERDRNHPALIGWCPFNETWDGEGWRRQRDAMLRTVYLATKAADPSRPCIDTSGNYHVITDIFDVHNYEQDPAIFRDAYIQLPVDGTLIDRCSKRQTYRGEPVFVSEYGGIGLVEGCDDSYNSDSGRKTTWSYGKAASCREEFYERYRGLTEAMLDNPSIFGFCYTQLYDVEQEKNGLYTYERQPKLDMEKMRRINTKTAACEMPAEEKES